MDDAENPLQTIFLKALEIVDADERARFLSRECAEDSVLRDEVEELLQADAASGHFLPEDPITTVERTALVGVAEALIPGDAVRGGAITERAGDRIGRYKLLQQIGEGGCGVVYMAEQEEPVRRKVALKVIKLGMDTRRVVARFEAERQALALMDHPNIARVLDAGATETGRPYFVMELVRGSRITDYCDQNNRSTQERLELFVQICQAIQHAHQKGIIHRDIKPSNILVTVHDGVPIPKVIDFGIAKATLGPLTDQTLFTAFEQFLGTPAYMSPEQAELTSLDVDTRSDIYSLGVLLYELLTGNTPFDSKDLLRSGLDELRRKIREAEPARPSTRLSTMSSADVTTVARRHSVEAPKFVNRIRGDLDWIVMKCLEKDRSRRYETANGLAMDIRRHLNHEPVLACPPSRLYEFRKTVRRHKAGFAAGAAIIATLTAGLLASTWVAVHARRAERERGRLQELAGQEARRARRAELDAEEKLRGSYLAQAQAGRWSRRAGRRFEGIELLRKAAKIQPGLDLRNEAIACMALADLHLVNEVQDSRWGDNGFSFDATGERYAFPDADGSVHVCRVANPADAMLFPGHNPPMRALEFSPDGRYLCLASCGTNDCRVEILDLYWNERVLGFTEPGFRTMAFSADSQMAAIAYEQVDANWPVRIFDLKLKKQIASFGHGSLPYYLRFHPQRFNLLLTSDTSPIVRVWDWTTGRTVKEFVHSNWVQGIDWHPNGNFVATGCADNIVRLWDAATGKVRASLTGHEWVPVEVSFSPDGAFLSSRGWEGVLRLWDFRTLRELVSRSMYGCCQAFSKRRNLLGAATGPGSFGILEATSGLGYSLIGNDLTPDERRVSCDFSPDGSGLIWTSGSGMCYWNLAERKENARAPTTGLFPHARFLPNSSKVFLGTGDGIEEWEAGETGITNDPGLTLRRRLALKGQDGPIQISADGRILAATSRDSVHLFNVTTGRETQRLQTFGGTTYVALSGDARLAATYRPGGGTNVQIWDVGHSNIVHELPVHPSNLPAFSPNNQWLVIGDQVEYRAWDIRNWQSLYSVPREAAGFYGYLAFSADSRILAVAISRSKVRLIESATGHELATLEGPDPADIHWITFSRDGTQLAVVPGSGPIQLWDLYRVRQQLASINLDWETPTDPETLDERSSK